jgi:hypothetical protein
MIRAFGPSMTTVRVIVKIIAFGKVKAVWVCEETIQEVCAGVESKQHPNKQYANKKGCHRIAERHICKTKSAHHRIQNLLKK